MSDENGEGLFTPQEGNDGAGTPSEQPEIPSQPEEEAAEEVQPKYVTEDYLKQALEDVRREVQSSRDKALSTFDKRYAEKLSRVDEIVAANKKAGIEMSPDKERALRMQALEDASRESGSANADGSPKAEGEAKPNVSMEAIIKETNARAAQIQQQAGIMITKDDPEWLLIDQSTPQAFLDSFRNAVYQKKLRGTGSSAPPEARIPSMGQRTKAAPGDKEQFMKEYSAAAGKGPDLAREIRYKYAAKGLNVDAAIEEWLNNRRP